MNFLLEKTETGHYAIQNINAIKYATGSRKSSTHLSVTASRSTVHRRSALSMSSAVGTDVGEDVGKLEEGVEEEGA